MENLYIIRNKITNKLIGLDRDSGGCPFETDLPSAKFWRIREDAKEYMKIMHEADWELCDFSYMLTPVEENEVSMFQVFDGKKPAQYPECAVSKSWSNSKFTDVAEAVEYAMNWLGCMGDPNFEWEINVPYYYGGAGDFVVIKRIAGKAGY
jgi:hypothetical protein